MSRHLVQRVAVLSLALSLILGLLPRLALCVGPDGHHAIESIDAACCDRAAQSTYPDVQAPGHRCAAGCIDTPLTVGLSLARGRADSASPPPLSAVTLTVTSLVAPQVVAHVLRTAYGVPFQSPPRILRTTVHLC